MFDAGHGCCWDAGWVSTFARSPAVSLSSSSPGHPGKRKEFLLKQIRSLRLSWRCTTAGRLRHLARSQGCVMLVQVERFREGKVPGWEVGWIFLAAMWNLGHEVVFHFSIWIETPFFYFLLYFHFVRPPLQEKSRLSSLLLGSSPPYPQKRNILRTPSQTGEPIQPSPTLRTQRINFGKKSWFL